MNDDHDFSCASQGHEVSLTRADLVILCIVCLAFLAVWAYVFGRIDAERIAKEEAIAACMTDTECEDASGLPVSLESGQ